jgi:hypothetical protein
VMNRGCLDDPLGAVAQQGRARRCGLHEGSVSMHRRISDLEESLRRGLRHDVAHHDVACGDR